MNAREQALQARLRGFEAPGESEAGERGRRLLLAAFAERAPARRRRLRIPRVVWPVLAALLTVGGVAVADHLRASSSPRAARASFAPVQVETGVVLALGKGLAYAVSARGRVRALGPASDGDLSPHGLNAVLASGSALVAVDVADGQERWRVPAHGTVSFPRWSLERTVPPCCRVAYLVRGSLYVVGGDGRGAHRVARGALAVPPAWRPGGDEHELAFASTGGVRLLAADSGRVLATLPAPRRPLELSWRADGQALAVVDASGVTLYSARGKRVGRLAVHGGEVLDGAYDPAEDRLVVLRRDDAGGSSLLVRGARGPLRIVRRLAVTAIGDLRLSPDGTSALIASREGDEWIDVRLRDGHLQLLRNVGARLRAGFAPRALAWAG